MRVYKGFNKDMTCTCGSGKYQYEIGRKESSEGSKTRRTGFHASENPLECMNWYKYDGKNIICLCEAEGVDEENSDVMCAKELTPIRKLGVTELAVAIMSYMYEHPLRDCRHKDEYVHAGDEETEAATICIARGKNPRAKVGSGGIIGLIEEMDGKIERLKLIKIETSQEAEKWYTLKEGEIVEAE